MRREVIKCDVCGAEPADAAVALWLRSGRVDICGACSKIPSVARMLEIQAVQPKTLAQHWVAQQLAGRQ